MARISDRCVIQLVEQKIVVLDDISGVELVFPPDQHQALADRLAEAAAKGMHEWVNLEVAGQSGVIAIPPAAIPNMQAALSYLREYV